MLCLNISVYIYTQAFLLDTPVQSFAIDIVGNM